MFQRICFFILGLTLLAAAGCRSCFAPYDNCQPTFVPERGDCCMGELYRSGSVFVDKNNSVDHSPECKSCGMSGSREDYIPSSVTRLPQNIQNTPSVQVSGANANVNSSGVGSLAPWSSSENQGEAQNVSSEFDLDLSPVDNKTEILPDSVSGNALR